MQGKVIDDDFLFQLTKNECCHQLTTDIPGPITNIDAHTLIRNFAPRGDTISSAY